MRADGCTLDTPFFRVLSDDQVLRINNATLHVLERTGVRLAHPKGRELLHDAGARVDGNNVHIPAFLVEEAIRNAPSTITLYNRDGKPAMHLEDYRSYFGAVVCSPWMLDPYTSKLRSLVADDHRLLTLVADYCPHISFISAWGANASDYPAEIRDHVACKMVFNNTSKPFGINANTPKALVEILGMIAIVQGGYDNLRAKPLIYHYSEPTSPLEHTDDAIEKLLICADLGVPLVYTPMTTAGATGPATMAGTIVISNADCLSGLVVHQLCKKGAPFVYGGMPSMMDMRTTTFSFGAPEFALMLAAQNDVGHWYRLPVYGTAGASDSKAIDEQTACELTFTCLTSALNGANLIHDIPLLGGCTIVSPEATLLCDEIVSMVGAFMQGVTVNEETLAEEVIHRVGPGGHFLGEDHTMQHFRGFWYPQVFDRSRTTVWLEAGAPQVGDVLNQRTREILETHTVEPLPDSVLQQLAEREKKWMLRE